MTEREARVARNESRFRYRNEALHRHAGILPGTIAYACECPADDCRELIVLTAEQYESVRADDRQFLVARGHEVPDVEAVVEDNGTWLVVRKLGEAGEVAERLAPSPGS
ncbi:MAG TPA: hypothetical protein VFV20_08930 [Candidatus Limnocylindria bacterium]|nr:hypothetical protein [Candidatus Limnocylindria bacterium]